MAVTAEQRARWARIIQAYESGENMDAIAAREGVDRKTVYNVARRAGLPNRHNFDPARRMRILDAYRQERPLREIEKREGVHPSQIRAMARKAGIPPRPAPREYPIDHGAFDRPTPVGWWLVGLLAADGSIARGSNQITLTQSERDMDVLHKFLTYVGSPGKPLIEVRLSPGARRRAHPRGKAYAAYVHSAQMQEALAKHGVVPGKTKILEFSSEAVQQPAVWLGMLDGDGWVSQVGQRGRPLLSFFGTTAAMAQCSAFWGARLTFQRVPAPSVRLHSESLSSMCLHGANAARGAGVLLAASPISLERKRRTLEAIVASEAVEAVARPTQMRT